MDDPHYACAPLDEWLPALTARAALHVVAGLPRSLRPLLESLPALAPDDVRHEGIVVVGTVADPEAPAIAARLLPGAWLVELLPTARGLGRTLLALRTDGSQAVALGHRSVLRWSGAGLCMLQQWASPHPTDVLVTLGRCRATGEPDA